MSPFDLESEWVTAPPATDSFVTSAVAEAGVRVEEFDRA